MNIKINETLISNVNITNNGDLLGLNFVTEMTLAELDTLFTPATSPEFRVVDDKDNVTAVYRNRKLITLCIDVCENENVVSIALQVTPSEIEEVEVLTAQVEEQAAANAEQAAQIAEQANVIAAQETKIAAQETEINNLKTALTDAETKITESENALAETQARLTETQTNLAETQAANDMLMECVLEMSEVVYA